MPDQVFVDRKTVAKSNPKAMMIGLSVSGIVWHYVMIMLMKINFLTELPHSVLKLSFTLFF